MTIPGAIDSIKNSLAALHSSAARVHWDFEQRSEWFGGLLSLCTEL